MDVIATIVTVVGGIITICWIDKIWRRDRKPKKKQVLVKEQLREKGALYFCYMGGSGTILCLECDYQKDIISFTHGAYECNIGRQCQNCGTFFSEYNKSEEYHKISPRTEPLLCPECGIICNLKKTRDNTLFCPQCKGIHLQYVMKYIT